MTDKITIKGTAPKFDDQVLKQRQAARHHQYHSTSESHGVARGTIPFEFLANVIELSNQGYELSNKYPITSTPLSYSAYMRKPEHVVTSDLEVLDKEVKQTYIADLEREREDFKLKLTAQLLQAAKLREQKKIEDAHKKRMADIEKEVNDTFGDLVIPE